MDKGELARTVTTFLADIERGRDPRSPFFKGVQSSGQRLYEILIEPVVDALGASDRLIILPDGALHSLPFGALIRPPWDDSKTARSWRYLAEWKPLDIVLSATLYAELRKGRRGSSRGKLPLVAAFGDPNFGLLKENYKNLETISDVQVRAMTRRGIFNWEPLPYTRQEVLQVACLHKNVQLFVGDAATEEQFKSIGQDVQVLHLATHGYLDDKIPLNSSVVLTIPENPPEGRENGLLQSWEIFESVRIDADLVVLSACQSAVGEEQGGEGLIGLTRAFQYAGARTVAASLWSVNDQATAELMMRFYTHLNAGMFKDQALQAAQVELIRGFIRIVNERGEIQEMDFSAPYYWAAFEMFGDWQ